MVHKCSWKWLFLVLLWYDFEKHFVLVPNYMNPCSWFWKLIFLCAGVSKFSSKEIEPWLELNYLKNIYRNNWKSFNRLMINIATINGLVKAVTIESAGPIGWLPTVCNVRPVMPHTVALTSISLKYANHCRCVTNIVRSTIASRSTRYTLSKWHETHEAESHTVNPNTFNCSSPSYSTAPLESLEEPKQTLSRARIKTWRSNPSWKRIRRDFRG